MELMEEFIAKLLVVDNKFHYSFTWVIRLRSAELHMCRRYAVNAAQWSLHTASHVGWTPESPRTREISVISQTLSESALLSPAHTKTLSLLKTRYLSCEGCIFPAWDRESLNHFNWRKDRIGLVFWKDLWLYCRLLIGVEWGNERERNQLSSFYKMREEIARMVWTKAKFAIRWSRGIWLECWKWSQQSRNKWLIGWWITNF